MCGYKLLGRMSLKSVNTNHWPINNRQNLAILCTKQLMVVHQTLFLPPQRKTEKVVWPRETRFTWHPKRSEATQVIIKMYPKVY